LVIQVHQKKQYGLINKKIMAKKDSALMRKLTASCKAAAKRKFKVYPSAYANMWASKQQKKGKC
jgi:hypothetical protein